MAINKLSLQIEKQQAVTKKRFARRIKQYFMLSAVSLPFLLWLGNLFTKIKISYFATVAIYSGILIAFWGIVLGLDRLVCKRAKKLRQIKNAKLVVEQYNLQVAKEREEKEKQLALQQEIKAKKQQKVVDETKIEKQANNELQKINNNVIISDKEKSQKLKQKKYGNYNNKRKK